MDQHHLHEQTGADSTVIVSYSQARQGTNIVMLKEVKTETKVHFPISLNDLSSQPSLFSLRDLSSSIFLPHLSLIPCPLSSFLSVPQTPP